MNILLLEDEPAHAEAIRRAFETSDLKAAVQIAGTLREYHEAVAVSPPNIALLDMVLPDGRALDALTFLPDACPFPILIMTSYGNEETAVEAMKAGVLDYIVKSPEAFATMPHAVERALREWNAIQERKQASAALRESEERFRTLYENSTLGLYRTIPDGRIILANPALVKMLGYSSFDDLSSRDLKADGFEPSYPRTQFVEKIEKEGAVIGLESAWKRWDGTTVFVRESARAIRDPEGRTLYYDGTVEDITGRREAEEEVRRKNASLEAINDIFRGAPACETSDGVGHLCLDLAQELTGSKMGFIGEVNAAGGFDTIALSDPGWKNIKNMKIRGLWGRVITAGKSLVVNEPSSHPDRVGLPEGHPPITAFLGVPLEHAGRTIGMISLANNESGYSSIDREMVESLSAAFVEALMRKRAEERLKETLRLLRQAMAATIQVLGLTVEARDPYTAGHQQRTTILAEAIAREMGLPLEKIEGLHMAGLVHDVGKISIPAEILSKPTSLTTTEYALVKTHAKKGFEILKDAAFPWPLAEIVYQHHERMDGSGYPRGLKGDEILMEARILALSDTVEAMVSHRPYRPAQGPKLALAEVEKNKGIFYDADVAETCLKLFREKRFSFPA
jgi:PAS domain S-box-containing protein/putative nucleotidyltransferase with HDIG domain